MVDGTKILEISGLLNESPLVVAEALTIGKTKKETTVNAIDSKKLELQKKGLLTPLMRESLAGQREKISLREVRAATTKEQLVLAYRNNSPAHREAAILAICKMERFLRGKQ